MGKYSNQVTGQQKNSQDYSLDQNYKRSQNSNVVDLVTHKQKQIEKKKNKLGVKNKKNDNSSEQYASNDEGEAYQFQDQHQGNNYNRYQKRQEKENKEKLLESINKLMAKNKINSKTAFQVPILSIQDFSMYDEQDRGQFAWNKMSSIFENNYKIYGIRVDSIVEFIRKMSDSLGRKQIQSNEGKQKQNQQNDTKAEKRNQDKSQRIAQLMSNQVKSDLTFHLQKNSQNLDINLRTKLMMRKDPLFQRTSRKFDHSSYASFFMNTLSLSNGLYMQINASDPDSENNPSKKQQKQQQTIPNTNKQNNVIDQEQVVLEKPIQKEQKQGKQKQYWTNINNMQLSTNQLKIIKQFEKVQNRLQKSGVVIYDQYLRETEKTVNYEHIIKMIMRGQLKSAFQFGTSYQFQLSQDKNNQQIENKFTIFIEDDQAKNPKQNHKQQLNNDKQQINRNQQQEIKQINKKQIFMPEKQLSQENKQDSKQIIDYQPVNNNQKNENQQAKQNRQFSERQRQKLSKNQKRIKKIKQVITIKQPLETTTRKKKIRFGIKDIIEQQRKQKRKIANSDRERNLFNAEVLLKFNRVLRKQRILPKEQNIFDIPIQRNLLQSSLYCKFQTKILVELAPCPTQEDIKRDKLKMKQRQMKELQLQNQMRQQNQKYFLDKQAEKLIKAQSESQQKSEIQQNTFKGYRKQPTITSVKQNIYQFMRHQKKTNFRSLYKKYQSQYGFLSSATLFIAMLHLTNQKFIKVSQFGKKNFKVQISDL